MLSTALRGDRAFASEKTSACCSYLTFCAVSTREDNEPRYTCFLSTILRRSFRVRHSEAKDRSSGGGGRPNRVKSWEQWRPATTYSRALLSPAEMTLALRDSPPQVSFYAPPAPPMPCIVCADDTCSASAQLCVSSAVAATGGGRGGGGERQTALREIAGLCERVRRAYYQSSSP